MLLAVLTILFVASFIRSAFGFGEALIAVPLLAFAMPVEEAAPIAALVSVTVAIVAIAQDWRHIHFRSAGRLFLATAAGAPLGLWALHALDGHLVKMVLGAVVMAFSLFALMRRPQATLHDDRHAWIFGFGAGVLGGAYGMNGPPLAVYGALRGWSPRHFRATLQGYFLPASLVTMAGYGLTGLWTPGVTRDYLLALPLVLVATLLGRMLNRRLGGPAFVRCLYAGLVLVGALLLLQSRGWLGD
ncbi:sulfite exporter TauE/SafE family protein [Rhodanobacter sp. DHB23]|uniref:sulfite exporter TauE/SafE family protein n=1 Tax=Rhodanobacter sp. DHB23 TaxID=2775923 RepID=UPI0031BB056B